MIDSWIIEAPAMPSDPVELKARYLRAMYRDLRSAHDQMPIVKAEYENLYGVPAAGGVVEHMMTNVWIEERKLQGQFHDLESQSWRNADGSRVMY